MTCPENLLSTLTKWKITTNFKCFVGPTLFLAIINKFILNVIISCWSRALFEGGEEITINLNYKLDITWFNLLIKFNIMLEAKIKKFKNHEQCFLVKNFNWAPEKKKRKTVPTTTN